MEAFMNLDGKELQKEALQLREWGQRLLFVGELVEEMDGLRKAIRNTGLTGSERHSVEHYVDNVFRMLSDEAAKFSEHHDS